jgi:hypothetical protein
VAGLRDREVGHDRVPSLVQRQVEVLQEVRGTPADVDGPVTEAGQSGVAVGVDEPTAGVAVGEARERGDTQRRSPHCPRASRRSCLVRPGRLAAPRRWWPPHGPVPARRWHRAAIR